MKAIHRSQEVEKSITKGPIISIENVNTCAKTEHQSTSVQSRQSLVSTPEAQIQIIPNLELHSQTSSHIPFHQYFNRQLLSPEVAYNETKLRSLALSSDLIDLRLAASRYASAFHSLRPLRRHELSLQPFHRSLDGSPSALPHTLNPKFYEHLIPRYDGRTLLMLPTMSNIMSAGTTTATNSLAPNWLLSNLVRN